MKLAMGNIKDQKHALEAQDNLQKSWLDLVSVAKVTDGDKPLVVE